MSPKVTTVEFFNRFYNEINRAVHRPNSASDAPDSHRPNQLAFTLKDAMPIPKPGLLARGDERHFVYMRKYIKDQFEKAKALCPGLKEFVILVTIPGTLEEEVSNDERRT